MAAILDFSPAVLLLHHLFLPPLSYPSPHEAPFHWMPLARLEQNRSRTPLLPEPTAMDMLYEQLKVRPRFLALWFT